MKLGGCSPNLRPAPEFATSPDAIGPALDAERVYTFPEQETKLKVGSRVMVLGEKGEIQILELNRKAGSTEVSEEAATADEVPRRAGRPA